MSRLKQLSETSPAAFLLVAFFFGLLPMLSWLAGALILFCGLQKKPRTAVATAAVVVLASMISQILFALYNQQIQPELLSEISYWHGITNVLPALVFTVFLSRLSLQDAVQSYFVVAAVLVTLVTIGHLIPSVDQLKAFVTCVINCQSQEPNLVPQELIMFSSQYWLAVVFALNLIMLLMASYWHGTIEQLKVIKANVLVTLSALVLIVIWMLMDLPQVMNMLAALAIALVSFLAVLRFLKLASEKAIHRGWIVLFCFLPFLGSPLIYTIMAFGVVFDSLSDFRAKRIASMR